MIAACHSGRVGKIHVVDDEQSMREFLGICLRRAGHEVTLAQSGDEALTRLRAAPIDIVVSDLKMPGGHDGLAILKAIKSGAILRAAVPGAAPTAIDPEVILVTAFATTDTAGATWPSCRVMAKKVEPQIRQAVRNRRGEDMPQYSG